MTINTIEHKEFAELAKSGELDGVRVVAQGRSWSVLARARKRMYSVASQRGGQREFARLDSAASYLSSVGIENFSVDHSGYDEAAEPRRSRPDSAAALRRTHKAAEHDKWFREQVRIGLREARSSAAVFHAIEDVEAEDDAWLAQQ